MEVIGWIDSDETEDFDESYGGLGGWFENGMRWKDYAEAHTEEGLEYAEALRESIIKRKLKITGSTHQKGYECVPVFSDGTIAAFSFRAWGDLLAAVWSDEEDKDYCYMDFYC